MSTKLTVQVGKSVKITLTVPVMVVLYLLTLLV